jgi:hypothetical protein
MLQKGQEKDSSEKQEIGRGEFCSLWVFCYENSLNLHFVVLNNEIEFVDFFVSNLTQ